MAKSTSKASTASKSTHRSKPMIPKAGGTVNRRRYETGGKA